MALRQKVNNVPRWPAVASTANLPNVAGSPTQSSYLEVSDECWVTSGGLYVCTVATLGAATWVLVVSTAGAQDKYEAAIIVGNALAGDTAANCTYLDSGNGAGIAAALAAAAALSPLKVDVFVRRGAYTMDPAAVTLPLSVGGNVVLRGDARETVTITTFTGAGGHAQDLFTLLDGATLESMTISVPAPVLGVVASSLSIVDFRDNATMRKLALNIADTGVNSESPFALSAYQSAPTSGATLDDIVFTYTRTTPSPTAYHAIVFDYSSASYTEPAKRNVVRNVRVTNSYGDLKVTSLYSTNYSIDVDGCSVVRAQAPNVVSYQPVSGTIAGPTIRRVHGDFRGYLAANPLSGPAIQPIFAAVGTNVIRGAVVEDVTLLGDANTTATNSYATIVNASTGLGTLDGVRITGVVTSCPTAGVGNVSIFASGNCTVQRGAITACVTGDGDIEVDAQGGAGAIDSIVVTGNECRDLLNRAARVTKSTIVGNRITGALTDTGTSTQAGLNNIG